MNLVENQKLYVTIKPLWTVKTSDFNNGFWERANVTPERELKKVRDCLLGTWGDASRVIVFDISFNPQNTRFFIRGYLSSYRERQAGIADNEESMWYNITNMDQIFNIKRSSVAPTKYFIADISYHHGIPGGFSSSDEDAKTTVIRDIAKRCSLATPSRSKYWVPDHYYTSRIRAFANFWVKADEILTEREYDLITRMDPEIFDVTKNL